MVSFMTLAFVNLDISGGGRNPPPAQLTPQKPGMHRVNVTDSLTSQYYDKMKQLTEKTEVLVNDDTGSIKVIFWGDALHIVRDKEDGVFELKNVRLNKFNEDLYLGSTWNTTCQSSQVTLKKAETKLPTTLLSVNLPASQIHSISARKNCPRCCASLKVITEKLVECNSCRLRTLAKNVKMVFTVKLYFTANNGMKITVFQDQVNKFLHLTGMEACNEEELSVALLTEEELKLLYNKKYICVGFSKL